MEITDNHFHLDPFGKKELAVKEFLRAGGTRLVLVHKPYASWKKIESFKEQVETTIKLSKRAREAGAKVAVVAAPHPVQFVKLLEHYDNNHASDIYLEAVDYCINLVEEKVTVGLGELGRPHFDVDSSIWESANSLLSESLRRAKEVEAAVVLHTESGTPEVMADLSKDPNYKGWLKLYEKNPEAAMMNEKAEEYLRFYNKKAEGGLMEATERLRRQGLRGGGFMSKRAMMYGK